MRARVKGINDPYREVQSINLNGEFYPPEVLEFEEEQVCAKNAHTANEGKVLMSEAFIRNQAAIAAMQAILSSDKIYANIMERAKRIDIEADVAHLAVTYANALIKELKRRML